MGILCITISELEETEESVTFWQYQVWAILPILSDFLGFRSESISEDVEKRQDSEPWQYASSYRNQQLYQNTPGCTHITQMDVIPPRTKKFIRRFRKNRTGNVSHSWCWPAECVIVCVCVSFFETDRAKNLGLQCGEISTLFWLYWILAAVLLYSNLFPTTTLRLR